MADTEHIIIRKQAFIQAILEVERHEELQMLILLECLDQLRSLTERVDQTLISERLVRAKSRLYDLFLSDAEWSSVLSDAQLDEWNAEFERQYAEKSYDWTVF